MNILVLEDDPERHRHFRRGLFGHSLTIVEKAEEAIAHLQRTKSWDAVFLDHDLGGETYVASGPGTGYEVACWLEENPLHLPTLVICHSLNYAGREKMLRALESAFRRSRRSPYGYLHNSPLVWMRLNSILEMLEARSRGGKSFTREEKDEEEREEREGGEDHSNYLDL